MELTLPAQNVAYRVPATRNGLARPRQSYASGLYHSAPLRLLGRYRNDAITHVRRFPSFVSAIYAIAFSIPALPPHRAICSIRVYA